jgi:hypothetical protein
LLPRSGNVKLLKELVVRKDSQKYNINNTKKGYVIVYKDSLGTVRRGELELARSHPHILISIQSCPIGLFQLGWSGPDLTDAILVSRSFVQRELEGQSAPTHSILQTGWPRVVFCTGEDLEAVPVDAIQGLDWAMHDCVQGHCWSNFKPGGPRNHNGTLYFCMPLLDLASSV